MAALHIAASSTRSKLLSVKAANEAIMCVPLISASPSLAASCSAALWKQIASSGVVLGELSTGGRGVEGSRLCQLGQ